MTVFEAAASFQFTAWKPAASILQPFTTAAKVADVTAPIRTIILATGLLRACPSSYGSGQRSLDRIGKGHGGYSILASRVKKWEHKQDWA